MARNFLLEIGTEELPASFVTRALEAMPALARELLAGARLSHDVMQPLGTPRRLALLVTALADGQEDLSEQVVGPPKSVALGADGKPTKAGEGFARKQGVDPSELRVVTTDKGDYVAVTREAKGLPARDVLPELLATLCARVPFQKSMRWGDGAVAFGRPVHWLVALHGDEEVPFEFAGVRSDRATRGHRFLAPGAITVRSADDYVAQLRDAHVRVDPDERRRTMEDALARAAKELGGVLVEDPFLVGECASLVEEPHVVPGRFDEGFLDLPASVIVSVMRNHQRYFALRSPDGLLPRYLNVVNTAKDPDNIARGNDRVLRARLADARFFVDEDRKITLEARIPKLDAVVFQAKLGSIGARARRLAELAPWIATGGGGATDDAKMQMLAGIDDAPLARRAALLCKTDLVTLIVGEFPELQGEMGRFYALEQGEDPRVADAIRDHYLPKGAGDDVATERVGAALAVADRADTLAGCFGIGLVPSGSADPFALRRAALGLVRTALDGPMDVRVRELLSRAHALYVEQGVRLRPEADVVVQLDQFFRARLRAFYGERFPSDLVEACLGAWDCESIRDLDARVRAVARFRELPEYESLAIAFKRAFNIAKDAPDGEAKGSLLEEGAERLLADTFDALRPDVEAWLEKGAYEEALTAIARDLRQPIDRFFEEVFVMVEDDEVRNNRLRLLGTIARTLTGIAHFHQLST